MTSGTSVTQNRYVSVLAKPNCIPKWFSLFSLFALNDNWTIESLNKS